MSASAREQFEILEQQFVSLNSQYTQLVSAGAHPSELEKLREDIKNISRKLTSLRN